MITEISKIEPPKWLTTNDFAFNLKQVVTDSLFCPHSDLNCNIISIFFENVYSFIYADFGIQRDSTLEFFDKQIFIDFKIIYHESLEYQDFDYFGLEEDQDHPNNPFDLENHPFSDELPYFELHQKDHQNYFEWMIFENSSGKRFSLLFMSAEPLAVYFALYNLMECAPKVVAVENGLISFDLVADYEDENDLFGQLILNKLPYVPDKVVLPEYLMLSDNIDEWESYPNKVCDINDRLILWGKKKLEDESDRESSAVPESDCN